MTIQTTKNDALLSLWALEQNFYQNEVENEPMMCLFSGGQDSSTLAWFLYHTESAQPSRRSLVHCTHLLQPDNFFMAQHAVNLSFWLGWHYTSIFSTRVLLSEKDASGWRASIRRRVGACTATWLSVNGHTETDKREANFFKFLRAPENAAALSIDLKTGNKCSKSNTFTLSYMGAYFGSSQSADTHLLSQGTQKSGSAARASVASSAVITNSNSSTPEVMRRPLILLTRKDARLLVASQRLPVYPDQTNFECYTTRAQIRYLVFPLLAKLGFTFFE